MRPEDDDPRSEREQTDESLRAEREKVDHTLEQQLAAIDETADAVITLARARADEVLAVARARTDRETSTYALAGRSRRLIEDERVVEDQTLEEERASADDTLQDERAEKVSLLATERAATDKDLHVERARSDDALATRDEFLGMVSHDLRNMLSAMVGSAALIAAAARDHSPEQIIMHAGRIQRAGARMHRLIGDLVDVASIEAGSLAVVREVGDPTHVVTEAVDTFQAQALAGGVSLVAEIVPPAALAAFDPARILQVLGNLLSNALKFTPRHGSVVARLECAGGDLRFSVSDTGRGIAADKLETVFVRFQQVGEKDRRGVGLGLYISRCIVLGHGGRIWAESRLGEGSTFCFTLPIHAAARA